MDKKAVKEYLPRAYEAVNKKKKSDIKRGDFSAFGATIIMSGLFPAISAYSKDEKKHILDILDEVTGEKLREKLKGYCKRENCKGETFDEEALTEKTVNAIIAVKLVLDAQ